MNHAYYNEIDPKAAAWLRELIKRGNIAPGDVDERSIEDVTPDDLRGYAQCHFFAGIGIWSHALRLAGWSDDRPIWTGSCPCQPFSTAGKGAGFDDERHLWPAFHWLIKQCRPGVVLGEQVAHKAGAAWFDSLSIDLEGEGYAVATSVSPACGFGAPHLRQRQYWVAHSSDNGTWDHSRETGDKGGSSLDSGAESLRQDHRESGSNWDRTRSADGELANPQQRRRESRSIRYTKQGSKLTSENSEQSNPSPTNGLWGAADWLFCRDGKWRPIKPFLKPLVDGSPSELVRSGDLSESDVESTKEARVMRLKGYGNGIVATQAQAFVEVVQAIITERSEVK